MHTEHLYNWVQLTLVPDGLFLDLWNEEAVNQVSNDLLRLQLGATTITNRTLILARKTSKIAKSIFYYNVKLIVARIKIIITGSANIYSGGGMFNHKY